MASFIIVLKLPLLPISLSNAISLFSLLLIIFSFLSSLSLSSFRSPESWISFKYCMTVNLDTVNPMLFNLLVISFLFIVFSSFKISFIALIKTTFLLCLESSIFNSFLKKVTSSLRIFNLLEIASSVKGFFLSSFSIKFFILCLIYNCSLLIIYIATYMPYIVFFVLIIFL